LFEKVGPVGVGVEGVLPPGEMCLLMVEECETSDCGECTGYAMLCVGE